MRILERRGYRVHEIEADDRRGRPVLKAEAFRNGREYDIVFSWPDLRIISERHRLLIRLIRSATRRKGKLRAVFFRS